MTENKFESWAIVELMGHVKLAGKLTEEERFGAKMGRIDIPRDAEKFVTQYFGGGSVYRITPTTEEIARAVAARNAPAPVHAWELPAPATPPAAAAVPGDERDFDEEMYPEDNDCP